MRAGGLLEAGKRGPQTGTCLQHQDTTRVIVVTTAQVRRVGLVPRGISHAHFPLQGRGGKPHTPWRFCLASPLLGRPGVTYRKQRFTQGDNPAHESRKEK